MAENRRHKKLIGFLRRCCSRCWLSLLPFLVTLLQIEKIKEVFIDRYTSIRWFQAVCAVFLCSKGPYFDLIGFRGVLTFMRLIGVWSRSEFNANTFVGRIVIRESFMDIIVWRWSCKYSHSIGTFIWGRNRVVSAITVWITDILTYDTWVN